MEADERNVVIAPNQKQLFYFCFLLFVFFKGHLEGGQHEGHVASSGNQAEGDGAVRSEHAQSLQTDAIQLFVQAPGVQAGHEELGRVHRQVVLQQTQRFGLLLALPHLFLLFLIIVEQVLLDGLLHRLLHLV